MNNKIKLIIELGRLRFLAAGFLLYILGVLLAINSDAEFSITYFIFGYAIMLPAHLSLSYSNNYFDIEADKKSKSVSISGGTKILVKNPDLIPLCRNIALGLTIISILFALTFIILFSYPLTFLLFIIFGNLLGWFYTAPPFRLAYKGLGEIANMINMGFLMPGIGYWTMNGNLDLFFIIFAFAFLLYGLFFIITVETPDMESDKKAKKMTLLVKIGRKKSYKILILSLVIASLYYLIIAFLDIISKINYSIIYCISLIPLVIAVYQWFKKPYLKKNATKIAENNLNALILFVIIMNTYLVINYTFLK